MEIGKKNQFVEFIKKYGIYLAVGLVIFIVALTFTLMATLNNGVQTGNQNLNFALPMENATVIKDYSDSALQKNETLNQWEAHMSIDLTSESGDVFAVLSGEVSSVDYDYLSGYTITIKHDNGFESIYSSMAEEVLVKVGDKVESGQKIGSASSTANGELDLGEHLHFTLKLNDDTVDPNNYLDLQEK